MKIVDVDDVEWFGNVGVREEGAEFKRLFQGEEMSPNNFEFTIVKVEQEYNTPSHRHNFDQVRFLLDGSFGYNDEQQQGKGSIGYFAEGTYYQQRAHGASHTLLLQTSSGSGSPYISFQKLRDTSDELRKNGEFKNGVYTKYVDGKKINQDAYEATWECAVGEKLKYSRPRFDRPVIMNPDQFEYCELENAPGVRQKHLGHFGERELGIAFLQFDKDATLEIGDAYEGEYLFYALEGEGRVNEKTWKQGTAWHRESKENIVISADTGAVLYFLRLPTRI